MNTYKVGIISLALSFVSAVALDAAWTSKRLTFNTGESMGTALAVSGSNVYVAWYDATPGNHEIFFKKSVDSGATWSASRRLTYNAGDSFAPDIAVNAANIYLVWADFTSGKSEIYFRKSIDNGATWQASKRLTFNTGDSYEPAIAVSAANIYVAWTDATPGNDEIYFRMSADGGASWESAKRLTRNAGISKYPAIAASGATLFLTWQDDTPGNYEIYFMKSTDGGGIWQNKKLLTNNTGWSQYPVIAISGATLFLTWMDATPGNYEVYFMKSTDGGATWPSAKRLTNNAGTSSAPDVAVNGGNICTVWSDDTTGNDEIYFRMSADGGATWKTAQQLTNNSGYSYNPRPAASAATVYVTWHDNTPGNFEVYLKYSPL